ncbi:unnamed protein product [Diatraea saccharalis]|uniref:Uncharacterized protein n=1 Tax=Diatraea saccharalis TaxID=40085 RepID=A0A9N9WHU2_9NEOP|nr:unnamed protein product [Diatraea saccharalis]
MGQEQSYPGHTSVSQVARYKDKYGPQYTSGPLYSPGEYDNDYKRHKPRRSGGSFKSDNSSTESSGYRSGSSTYESHSNRSSKNDYYCTSLYKNDHYKDVNKELYRPVKIKEKKHLQLLSLEKDEFKSARLKSYLDEAEKAKHTSPSQKKAGIRNYTPKILSEEEQRKKVDNWI